MFGPDRIEQTLQRARRAALLPENSGHIVLGHLHPKNGGIFGGRNFHDRNCFAIFHQDTKKKHKTDTKVGRSRLPHAPVPESFFSERVVWWPS